VAPTLTVGAKWLGQKAHPHRRRFTKPNHDAVTETMTKKGMQLFHHSNSKHIQIAQCTHQHPTLLTSPFSCAWLTESFAHTHPSQRTRWKLHPKCPCLWNKQACLACQNMRHIFNLEWSVVVSLWELHGSVWEVPPCGPWGLWGFLSSQLTSPTLVRSDRLVLVRSRKMVAQCSRTSRKTASVIDLHSPHSWNEEIGTEHAPFPWYAIKMSVTSVTFDLRDLQELQEVRQKVQDYVVIVLGLTRRVLPSSPRQFHSAV